MIGDLYNAAGVVVGQAAVMFAPANTPLPNLTLFSFSDPFSATPFTSQTLTYSAAAATAALTAFGQTIASGVLTGTSTSIQIQAALNAATAALGITWLVTGTAPGPFTVTPLGASEQPGSLVAGTATGGTVTLTPELWTPAGSTDAGWQFGTNKSVTQINIEEQSSPVANTINTQNVTINGSLAEELSETIALAINGTLTTTAAATTTPGFDEINPTDTVITYSVAMLSQRFDGKPMIHYAPAFTQLNNVTTDFRRATNKRLYPVSFSTVCKPSQIRIIRLVTPHL